MRIARVASLGLLLAPLVVGGCSPGGTEPAPATDAAKAEPANAVPTEPAKPVNTEPEPAKVEPAKPEPTTAQVEPAPAQVEPAKPESTTIETLVLDSIPKVTPVPGTLTWQERPELAAIRSFHPFILGVLADCSVGSEDAWCEIDKSGKLVPSKMTHPDQDLFGIWPSDTWQVRIESQEDAEGDEYREWDEVELLRWTGSRFARNKKFDIEIDPLSEMAGHPNYAIHEDWSGGMLVNLFGGLTRYRASGSEYLSLSGDVYDAFSTEAGSVLRFAHHDNMAFDAPCTAMGCGAWALRLPSAKSDLPADGWTIENHVPRGKDALTIAASFEDSGDTYLFHYDPPAPNAAPTTHVPITVETLDPNPEVIRPDDQGGLWLEATSTLWYREASGRWLDVPGPAGSLDDWAMRAQPRELLIVVEGPDGVSRVFASVGLPVAAAPQPAPPSQPAPQQPALPPAD